MGHPESAYAYNETRQAFLATALMVANTHWLRLKGLIGTAQHNFTSGRGLWIVPCHGVHTIAMSFPIDVIYLDSTGVVIHLEHSVQPWRLTPLRLEAATVVELPSHTIAMTATQVGDRIEIKSKASLLSARAISRKPAQ